MEVLAALALDGIRPFTSSGEPIETRAFQSSVAIVAPSEYDGNVKTIGDLKFRPICSGTRISRTGVLTAAHCVCALGLDKDRPSSEKSRKIRIGNSANAGRFQREFSVVPNQTSCYPSRENGGCDNFCSSLFHTRVVTPQFSGTDIAIIHFDGAFLDGLPNGWNQITPISSKSHYDSKMSNDAERHFLLGFGFNPEIPPNFGAGLGIKRCGQMVRGDACGSTPDNPCKRSLEFILKGDPDVQRDTDACPGDSGGGVFLMESSIPGNRSFSLAGLVSRGPTIPGAPFWGQCGKTGSVYSFASDPTVIEWIKTRIKAAGEESSLHIKK